MEKSIKRMALCSAALLVAGALFLIIMCILGRKSAVLLWAALGSLLLASFVNIAMIVRFIKEKRTRSENSAVFPAGHSK